MTDPTLPRRAVESVPPPPGMLRAIRAEARRRRVRRLQVASATGMSTLMVVSALVLVGRGASTVGLEPTDRVPVVSDPGAPRQAEIAPSPTASPASAHTSARATTAGRAATPTGGAAAGSGPSLPRVDVASPRPERSAAARPDADRGTRSRPPVARSERDAGVQAPCTAGAAVPDWCLAAVVDSGSSGERSTLQLVACPTDRTADHTLTYARSEETRFTVHQGGRLVWSSEAGSRAEQHVVTVTSGRCVVWAVEWDQTDEAGRLVDPGSYDLTTTSYAAEVADAPTSSTTFDVGGAA